MTRTPADRGYQYFPAFLDLVRKRLVVVGGGDLASSKVRSLLPCGVEPLVVVAPRVSSFIAEHAGARRLCWWARDYQAGDLDGAALAFAATDDRLLNAQVAAEARAKSIPVLAVDDVPNCDFIAPALVRRGDLVFAISTNGRSPAMARRARPWLDQTVPRHWGALLDVAATARQRLGPERAQIPADRWQVALAGAVDDLVHGDAPQAAIDKLLEHLRQPITQ